MDEILKNALNKGVPVDTPILIDINEFLTLFEKEELIKEYRESISDTVSQISNIIEMYSGTFMIPTYATLATEDNQTRVLRFSGSCYYLSMAYILQGKNCDEIFAANQAEKMYEMLKKKFMTIKTPEELKENFPILYELYLDRLEGDKCLIELEKLVNNPNVPLELKLKNTSKITNNFKKYYSNFDLKMETEFSKNFTFSRYLARIIKALEKLFLNAEEIIDIYYNHILDINSFTEEESDKLNLYIAAKYIEEIEKPETKDKQRYLFYLTNYFKENVEMQITRVKIKLKERKVTPITLYQKYKDLLLKNPDLLAVNFSYDDFQDMSREEIEDFVGAYLSELHANWELLPSDDISMDRKIRSIVKRKAKNMTEEERKQKEERLLNLYIEKKTFFDGTDPYFRIKGKQTFDGYIGYIYSNSLVVLERYYKDVEETKLIENEAIYILRMQDFYELSKHSKIYLMASPLCKRVYHRGQWQERVLNYIRKDIALNPAKDTQKLILEKKVQVEEKKL